MAIIIENCRAYQKFQIYHGGEFAGFVQYRLSGTELWLLHTALKRQFLSTVLLDVLMRHVMLEARCRHLAVLPLCPAMRTLIAEHADFSRLVPAEWFELLPLLNRHDPPQLRATPPDFLRLGGAGLSLMPVTPPGPPAGTTTQLSPTSMATTMAVGPTAR